MHIDTEKNADLDKIWNMILERLGKESKDICPNSSSFYKTQDGMECSLRKSNGDLLGICYRENNRNNGYRWTIQKYA